MERLVDDIYTFKGKVEDVENDYIIKVQKKVKEYEDAEEQGLLLRLPCPIGTKVYVLVDECEEMYEPDSWYTTISEESFDLYMVDCFGKEVFLTREEAEAALAEKGGAE